MRFAAPIGNSMVTTWVVSTEEIAKALGIPENAAGRTSYKLIPDEDVPNTFLLERRTYLPIPDNQIAGVSNDPM